MRTRRTLFTAAAALTIVPLALAGCSAGGGGASGGDPKTITILDYYNNEPDKGLVQDLLDQCAADLDLTIERESVPGKDLIQKVLQRASSKTLPDVLMLDNPDVQEIAASGALAPLSDFDVDTSGYIDGIIEAATYEGEVYGLAPAVNTLGLFYNVDTLEAAGIAPPTTWAELKDAAAKLTVGDQYGMAFSAIATYEGSWQFLPFMWTNGGDETDLQTPENAEALQLWVDLVDSGSASQSVINWSQGDVKDQFAAGKAAMMVNGPWNIPALNETDVNWASVQLPVNEAGQTPVAPLGGEVWTVPQTGDAEKQANAAKFVECMGSDDIALQAGETRFTVPTRTDVIPEFTEKMPDMAAFAEQVVNARSRTGKLGEEWPTQATVIYNAIQLALTGKATPDVAFEQAAQG